MNRISIEALLVMALAAALVDAIPRGAGEGRREREEGRRRGKGEVEVVELSAAEYARLAARSEMSWQMRAGGGTEAFYARLGVAVSPPVSAEDGEREKGEGQPTTNCQPTNYRISKVRLLPLEPPHVPVPEDIRLEPVPPDPPAPERVPRAALREDSFYPSLTERNPIP